MQVAPGVKLRVVEAGEARDEPTLVFIPGWSASADIWSDQIRRFSPQYRVISFDPRSQGQSTKTMLGNTPEQRAADLHALLAVEHVQQPLLIGWSQAAQDVAAYVSTYGTSGLSGIVLVDAAISEGSSSIASHPQQAAAQFDRFAIYAAHQEAYLRGMYGFIVSKPQPPGLIDRAVAAGMRTPTSIGIAQLVADMFGNDLTPALAKMDCPVLIIAAASSEELSRQRAEARVVRGAQFVTIEHSAHAIFLDQPDRFQRTLAQFVERVSSAK